MSEGSAKWLALGMFLLGAGLGYGESCGKHSEAKAQVISHCIQYVVEPAQCAAYLKAGP